jgi:peptide chain release factor 3
MKIERERGISVSRQVMTFDHEGLMFNLLDTPGHEDFSEDTYRTLTAADAAVMVLDAAKGIEPQTLKLFEVCRLRGHPDRHLHQQDGSRGAGPIRAAGRDRVKLALDPAPLYWPAGSGARFKGMLDLRTEQFTALRKRCADSRDRRTSASLSPSAAMRSLSYLDPGREVEELSEGADADPRGFEAL